MLQSCYKSYKKKCFFIALGACNKKFRLLPPPPPSQEFWPHLLLYVQLSKMKERGEGDKTSTLQLLYLPLNIFYFSFMGFPTFILISLHTKLVPLYIIYVNKYWKKMSFIKFLSFLCYFYIILEGTIAVTFSMLKPKHYTWYKEHYQERLVNIWKEWTCNIIDF